MEDIKEVATETVDAVSTATTFSVETAHHFLNMCVALVRMDADRFITESKKTLGAGMAMEDLPLLLVTAGLAFNAINPKSPSEEALLAEARVHSVTLAEEAATGSKVSKPLTQLLDLVSSPPSSLRVQTGKRARITGSSSTSLIEMIDEAAGHADSTAVHVSEAYDKEGCKDCPAYAKCTAIAIEQAAETLPAPDSN